ncbi:hypothetical protein WDU94_008008 [Cyamophila willieti]
MMRNIENQAKYYNRGTRELPRLKPGDNVWMKDPKSSCWSKGQISEESSSPRSYWVQPEDGGVLKRNSRFLRKILLPSMPKSETMSQKSKNGSQKSNKCIAITIGCDCKNDNKSSGGSRGSRGSRKKKSRSNSQSDSEDEDQGCPIREQKSVTFNNKRNKKQKGSKSGKRSRSRSSQRRAQTASSATQCDDDDDDDDNQYADQYSYPGYEGNGPSLPPPPPQQACGCQQNGLQCSKTNPNVKTLELHIDMSQGKNNGNPQQEGDSYGETNEESGDEPPTRVSCKSQNKTLEASKKMFEKEFEKLTHKLKKELAETEAGLPCLGPNACCPCATSTGRKYLKDACRSPDAIERSIIAERCPQKKKSKSREKQNQQQGGQQGGQQCQQGQQGGGGGGGGAQQETTVVLDARAIAELTKLLSSHQQQGQQGC